MKYLMRLLVLLADCSFSRKLGQTITLSGAHLSVYPIAFTKMGTEANETQALTSFRPDGYANFPLRELMTESQKKPVS